MKPWSRPGSVPWSRPGAALGAWARGPESTRGQMGYFSGARPHGAGGGRGLVCPWPSQNPRAGARRAALGPRSGRWAVLARAGPPGPPPGGAAGPRPVGFCWPPCSVPWWWTVLAWERSWCRPGRRPAVVLGRVCGPPWVPRGGAAPGRCSLASAPPPLSREGAGTWGAAGARLGDSL